MNTNMSRASTVDTVRTMHSLPQRAFGSGVPGVQRVESNMSTHINTNTKMNSAQQLARSSSIVQHKSAGLASMQSVLSGAKPAVDNSLRMQSIASNSGMNTLKSSMPASVTGPGVALPKMSMSGFASRASTLALAVGLVFGGYALLDTQFAIHMASTIKSISSTASAVLAK